MLLLSQRPLSASDADSELFVDRSDELKRIGRALDLGFNVYVWGSRGSGRTSFLRQIQRLRPESRYARFEGLDKLQDQLDEAERALVGTDVLERHRTPRLGEVLGWSKFAELGARADPLRHLRVAAAEGQQGDAHVLLIDDLAPDAVHEIFGRLRDDLWQLPIRWVVAGSTAHLDAPADSFFDVSVELLPLDRNGLAELLRRRAASGTQQEGHRLRTSATSALEAIAPCTPRRALTVLRDLYLADDAAEVTNGLSRFEGTRARLKPTANKVLEALLAHGPAHAGDERLLTEVGVTRSRIVQVLAELEAEGLVSAQRVGRRKLYAAVAGGDVQEKPGDGSTSDRLI